MARSAFSLIELLIVIAIIALLTVLARPALQGLARGHNLTVAGTVVTGMLDRARGQAMARNAPTAVVVATQSGTAAAADYRAIALFQFDAVNTAWSQTSPWYFLPSTTLFDASATESGVASFFTTVPMPTTALPTPRLNGADSSFACQYFLPSGQVYGQSEPVRLRLIDTHPSGTTTNFYDILINQDTGRLTFSRP